MKKKAKKTVSCQKTSMPLGPPPKSTSNQVSKCMKGNKATGTKPELQLRKALWEKGIRGYRLNWKKVPGRPDICFPGKKIAIFVHGCFWHRCPICKMHTPKRNTEYWKLKFKKNIQRDRDNQRQLHALGWQTIIVWECEINKGVNKVAKRIKEAL